METDKEFFKRKFAERLKQLREGRGIVSSSDMAKQILDGEKEPFISDPQKYWNYENRVNLPSLDMLFKLAKFFHVTTDYLLLVSDEPIPMARELSEQTGLSQMALSTLIELKEGNATFGLEAVSFMLSNDSFLKALLQLKNAKIANARVGKENSLKAIQANTTLTLEGIIGNAEQIPVSADMVRDIYIDKTTDIIKGLLKEFVMKGTESK